MDPMIPLTLQQRPDEKGKIYGVAPAVITAVRGGERDGRATGDVQVYFP